jgi:hypothetical protein
MPSKFVGFENIHGHCRLQNQPFWCGNSIGYKNVNPGHILSMLVVKRNFLAWTNLTGTQQ